MTHDPTEAARRRLTHDINIKEAARTELEQEHGQVWDTQQLQADFTVTGFMSPYVRAIRKADGVAGLLMFQHSPRFYFDFQPDSLKGPSE